MCSEEAFTVALYLRNLNTACKHLRAVRRTPSPRRWPLWACSAASSAYNRRDTERAQTRPVGCRCDGLPAAPSCMDAGAIGEGPQL